MNDAYRAYQQQVMQQQMQADQMNAAQQESPMGLGAMMGMQQPQNQGSMQPPPPSPFQRGVQAAMQAAQQSLGLGTPDERRQRARALGIIQFGNQIGQPSPYQGKIGDISQALGSGFEAYRAERAKQAEMDAALYQEAVRQKELEREMNRQAEEAEVKRKFDEKKHSENLSVKERHEELMGQRHAETLGESKRHHEMMAEIQMGKIKDKNGNPIISDAIPIPGLEGIEGIPFSSMEKKEKELLQITGRKIIDQAPANEEALMTVNEMKDIFTKYPDSGSSFINLLEGKESNSIMKLLNQKFGNDEKTAAYSVFKKLSADLTLSTVLGMPAKVVTDLIKRTISDATLNGTLLADAFAPIAKDWEGKLTRNLKRAHIYEVAFAHKMSPFLTRDIKENTPQPQPSSSAPQMQQRSPSPVSTQNESAPPMQGVNMPNASVQQKWERHPHRVAQLRCRELKVGKFNIFIPQNIDAAFTIRAERVE